MGKNHISIPKELRTITIDLRTWESTTRYDSGVVIEKPEVEAGYAVVKNYMDKVYADFIRNAFDTLKPKLSSNDMKDKTPEIVVIQNLKLL